VKHFIKDLDLALAQAKRFDLDARGVALVRALYTELSSLGHDNDGTQSLFRLYDR